MAKKIPKKNYYVLIIVIIGIFLLGILGTKIYNAYKIKQIGTSPLVSFKVGEVKYEDLDSLFLEQGSESFLYISYVNSKDVYNVEKKLKKIIKDYNLQDKFFYYNATEKMNEENFIKNLNDTLKLNNKITTLPAVIFYKDNKITDFISSRDNYIMTDADFVQLLEKYEIEK